MASAGPVEDLVGGLQNTVDQTVNSVNGLLDGGAAPAPAPAADPAPTPLADGGTTEPGIDGTNPHGQGEVLDLTTDLPILQDVVGTVIVGQTRGEQDGAGNYHGNVTILSVSGLGVDVSFPTDEGETETSPLDAVNEQLLDSVCSASGICLALLEFESSTNGSGSQNSFSVARANVLDGLVAAGAAQSEGNISDDGTCQTANGSSNVASADALDVVSADTIQSESESEACNDGTESADADSEVVDLTALDIDLGDLVETGVIGCEDGDTVDDPFSVAALLLDQSLASILSGVCNGDDTNGAQADSPYNVRKALGADVLDLLEDLLGGAVALDVSTSESLARAPGEPDAECPDPNNPECPPVDECPDASNPDCPDNGDECPDADNPDCPDSNVSSGGPGGPSAGAPDDEGLPFTGADLGTLGAIGLGVMALGLALMASVDRRRRMAQG